MARGPLDQLGRQVLEARLHVEARKLRDCGLGLCHAVFAPTCSGAKRSTGWPVSLALYWSLHHCAS